MVSNCESQLSFEHIAHTHLDTKIYKDSVIYFFPFFGAVKHNQVLFYSDLGHDMFLGETGQLPALLSLATSLQNVLAVFAVELVKVLQLGGLERQVVCGKSNTSTHHNQLGLKVLHHVAQEVV